LQLDTVVKLVMVLHKRFSTRILDIPDLLQLPEQLDFSHSISANFDALVASLYPPQNIKEVKQAADAMIQDATQLCKLSIQQAQNARKSDSDVAEQLSDLQVTDGKDMTSADGPHSSDLKWLSFWQEQMEKACGAWRGTDL
jgi:hypothetical protein